LGQTVYHQFYSHSKTINAYTAVSFCFLQGVSADKKSCEFRVINSFYGEKSPQMVMATTLHGRFGLNHILLLLNYLP